MSDLATLAAAVNDNDTARVVTLADYLRLPPIVHPEVSGYRLARICALRAAVKARAQAQAASELRREAIRDRIKCRPHAGLRLEAANALQREAIATLCRAQDKLIDLRRAYYGQPPLRRRWEDMP